MNHRLWMNDEHRLCHQTKAESLAIIYGSCVLILADTLLYKQWRERDQLAEVAIYEFESTSLVGLYILNIFMHCDAAIIILILHL